MSQWLFGACKLNSFTKGKNMNPIDQFAKECHERIESYAGEAIEVTGKNFVFESTKPKYSYNFSWLSRPIIQYPQDMIAMQELIWQIRPDLIIETGVAHGGSLILSASMLALLDMDDAIHTGKSFHPAESKRKVLGIDIDIREHNRQAIEAHSMASRIKMIQGSSIAPEVITQVKEIASTHQKILVLLDSNHTHDHVLAELEAYAPLTSSGSYCVVFDTLIEDLPQDMYPDRPWGPGNNPKTAVFEYLKKLQKFQVTALDGKSLSFVIDKSIDYKLLISVAPDGYLKRVG
jgi:cephalosporin hydroxylase